MRGCARARGVCPALCCTRPCAWACCWPRAHCAQPPRGCAQGCCPAGRAAAEAAAALRGVRGRAHSARRPPAGVPGRHAAPLAGKPPLAKSAVLQRKRLCWGGRRARFKSCAGRKGRPAGMAAPCAQGVLAQNAAAGHKSVPVPLCWRKKACIIEKTGRCGACPRTRAHTGAGRPGRRDEKGACML